MECAKERSPFVIEFKSNYGTASSLGTTPTTTFCLQGQSDVHFIDHCHQQRTDGIDIRARKKLIIASILCLCFMTAEVIGGVLSNSLAIATDAAHLLTDFASFMISLFAIWLAGRPSTQRLSFGWYRAEVIGAVASVVMIWVITGILIYLAIQRLINADYEIDAKIMLITSALAIIVNVIMGVQLSHSHSHGGEHHLAVISVEQEIEPPALEDNSNQPEDVTNQAPGPSKNTTPAKENKDLKNKKKKNKKSAPPKENINVRAAFIHVLGDVIQSIGVFIAALVIYFKPEWAIADPICTFFFSVIVLFTTFSIMKDALLVLMEGTPSYLQYAEVMSVFSTIDGVERVHNLRIWALSINKIALSAHLAIRPGADPKKILQDATKAVNKKYNFFEVTIQIEDFTPDMEGCIQCKGPNS